MDDIQLLINGYLDDELTGEERQRLAALLQLDAASVDRLAYDSFIHFQLLDWMHQQRVEDGSTPAVFARLDDFGDRPARPTAPANRTATTPPRVRLWSLGAVAATLLVAGSITLLAYFFASRPVIVAQVTKVSGSKWGDSQPDLGVGSLLQSGQELSLVEGSALITFASGAQLLVEAPAALRLDSAMGVHLQNGRIAARVPTPARGFVVTSSLARFVDLGTAFTLNLVDEKSFEFHVFEGLVELQLDERFGAAVHQPLRVAEVRAYKFDVESGDVEPLEFQEGKQMPF
jgi:ferric-dicitrate binding protein FerR (iron transport regulator)